MKKLFMTRVPLQTSIFAEKIVRRKKTKPFYGQVMITGIGSEGKSLAKVGDKVVFTDHAIPGDVVDLQVTVSKKRYEEARVVRYHAYSPDRTDPFCRHFGLCGGCKWQFLPYQLQLSYKQQQVQDQLERIGKIELPPMLPILGSEETRFYRNKLEFSFSDNRWLTKDELDTGEPVSSRDALGFHVPGMFDKIFQVDECWLQPEPSNKIRNFLYDYATREGLEFYNIKNRGGFLRSLIIRTSATGGVMVILSFFREDHDTREKLLKRLTEEFPEITSLFYVINPKGNDTITDLEPLLFHGDDHITEEMEGLRFRIGPKSFFQTNSRQALHLYQKVRELAGLRGDELVYDLYCGTGTIALFLARACLRVTGLEYVAEATEDARINARNNGIENVSFIAGDIRDLLNPSLLEKEGRPSVIITDPPRAGMHGDVVAAIVEAAPTKVVYVSCNPATQARDLALMNDHYRVETIQPVDMFPHTHHVENIVLLVRREDHRAGLTPEAPEADQFQ